MEARPGYVAVRATGSDVARFARNEAGGHRWQRVPPTEKRGRVHTSTITVAVLPTPRATSAEPDPRDVHIQTTGAGGAGGQHVNKRDTAVVATHLPTGTKVRIEGRSQHRNRELALQVLTARLAQQQRQQRDQQRNDLRRAAVGRGMRADKRRTVAVQRDSVTDHANARTTSTRRYKRGHIDELWT